jgi:threonine dehydratase
MDAKPSPDRLTLAAIRAAHERIRERIHRTPILTSATLDQQSGGVLVFKCENMQKCGAFKARGATNAVFSLTDAEAAHGVATHSSGNHGAAVSRAAKLRGIPAYIVMPHNVPKAKRALVERLGGKIAFCEPTIPAREAAAARILADTGATFVHPYDDLRVMAGQGTATLELLDQAPDLDTILCPIGGGGLISGTAVAALGIKPGIRVIGVEPAGADDASRSFQSGTRIPLTQANTIADGLRGSLSDRTFTEIRSHVADVVTVSEEAIVAAMRTIWEVLKVVVEPSAAVPYAAVLENKVDVQGHRVGIILTGGNLDLDSLPWIQQKS